MAGGCSESFAPTSARAESPASPLRRSPPTRIASAHSKPASTHTSRSPSAQERWSNSSTASSDATATRPTADVTKASDLTEASDVAKGNDVAKAGDESKAGDVTQSS